MAHDHGLSDQARDHYDLGQLLVAAGSYTRAQAQFEKAIKMCPDVATLHLALGQVFLFQKTPDLTKAIRSLLRVIDLNPSWAEGHYWLGVAQEQKGELLDAIASFEQAVHLAPSDARPLVILGVCLSRLGRFDAAILQLRRAIDMKPRYGEAAARVFLADALRCNGEIEGACEQWKLILEMPSAYPEHDDQARNKARQLLKKHRVPQAG